MDVLEEFFPSKHLKAADLDGKEIKVTIARVEREKLGDEMKPVVYFNGKQKGVALNKGNTQVLAEAFGRKSEDWFGREVILYAIWTEYQNKSVQGLRLRVANDAPMRQQRPDPISSGPIIPTPPPHRVTGGVSDNLVQVADDDIPF